MGNLKSIANSNERTCPEINIHGEEHDMDITWFLFCLFVSFLQGNWFECKLLWSVDIFSFFFFFNRTAKK